MARKPNYKFERNERDRIKAEKKAKRAAEKQAARESQPETSEATGENDAATTESPKSE